MDEANCVAKSAAKAFAFNGSVISGRNLLCVARIVSMGSRQTVAAKECFCRTATSDWNRRLAIYTEDEQAGVLMKVSCGHACMYSMERPKMVEESLSGSL